VKTSRGRARAADADAARSTPRESSAVEENPSRELAPSIASAREGARARRGDATSSLPLRKSLSRTTHRTTPRRVETSARRQRGRITRVERDGDE